MTAADLPNAHGKPNNGFEGFRFLGYPPYDGLVNWDLRHSPDQPADITPGLFTAWRIDEGNPLRWLFTVRQGMKFHDGSDFTADAVIWNLSRVYDDKAPRRAGRADRQGSGIDGRYLRQDRRHHDRDDDQIPVQLPALSADPHADGRSGAV
jgi:ABC-type transport system substrate-binding protein